MPGVAYIEINPYPEFMTKIPDQVFEITPEENEFKILLPRIIADDLSQVSMEVEGFELESDGVFLYLYDVDESFVGTYEIKVTLIASGYYETEYIFNLRLKLQQVVVDEPEEFKFDFESELAKQKGSGGNDTDDAERDPIQIIVEEITHHGELTLTYSEDLFDLSNYDMVNMTFLNKDLSQIILLEYKSFADNEDELVPVLKSYKIIKFTSTEIVLSFNFTNPLLVSSTYKKDLFSVKIISNEYFMA